MHRRNQGGVNKVGKNEFAPSSRYIMVQPAHTRHATPQHDNIRVQHIQHVSQPPRQSVLVPCHRRLGSPITPGRRPDDTRRSYPEARRLLVVAAQAGPGDIALDAAAPPAVTVRPRKLGRVRPGQRIVAPLPGNAVRPRQEMSAYHRASTRACADDHAEDDLGAGPGTIRGLRQSKAVGVVRQTHGSPERRGQIGVQGLAEQPARIRILDHASVRRQYAGRADTDRAARSELRLDLLHQRRNRRQGAGIAADRRRDAAPHQHLAVVIKGRDFDFGASQINADAHLNSSSSRHPVPRCPGPGVFCSEAVACRRTPATRSAAPRDAGRRTSIMERLFHPLHPSMIRPARLLLLGIALLAGACAREGSEPRPAPRPVAKAHLVETATARVQLVGRSSLHTGSIRARRILRVFSQEEGRITELPFYEGDRVDEGTLLVRLDDALLRAQLNKANATRRQTELDLRRLEGLNRRKLVSEDELARARTAVEVAQAEESVLRTRLGYTAERAPFAGVIQERLAEPGDVVSKHTHILTLTDPTSLVIELGVSELTLPQLRVGDEADVRIDALGPEPFGGRILRIHPSMDPRTRQGMVEIVLIPIPASAAMGQFCRVTLRPSGRRHLLVPFTALRRDRQGEFVFRLDPDNRAVRVPVRSGEKLSGQVEILDGIEDGDQIVVRGFLGLRQGMPVKVVRGEDRNKAQG